MLSLIEWLQQRFCRHEWRMTRFQALVPGTSYECTKCGKMERRD